MKFFDISVVIPFYNEIHLVKDAVTSVYSQSIIDETCFQIIIINDGDYDNARIISTLPPSPSPNCELMIVSNNQIKGAGGARNKGIDICTGEFIAFLDADDYWHEEKVEKQLSLLRAGYNFVSTGYSFGKNNDSYVKPPSEIKSKKQLLLNTNVGTSSVILKKDLLKNYRFSDREFSQDTELWAKLASQSEFKYSSVDSCLTIYRPSQRTRGKIKQALHFFRLCMDLDLQFADFFQIFLTYSIKGFFRHFFSWKKI